MNGGNLSARAMLVPAAEVPVEALGSFATRTRGSLGEGFVAPPTCGAWSVVLSDPSQRWYAIVDRADGDEATVVLGLVVFSRWTAAPWRSAEIGFGLDGAVIGQGVVQRTVPPVIHMLLRGELARIEARVDSANERASRTLSALGFRFEGHARGCLDGSDQRRTQEQWAIITADLQVDRGRTTDAPTI